MQIVEKIRKGAIGNPTRDLRVGSTTAAQDERDALMQRLRRVTERNSRSFDEGFAAAVAMVARGADLEQLRGASGVVSVEWEDTTPIEFEAQDTLVDAVPLPDDY